MGTWFQSLVLGAAYPWILSSAAQADVPPVSSATEPVTLHFPANFQLCVPRGTLKPINGYHIGFSYGYLHPVTNTFMFFKEGSPGRELTQKRFHFAFLRNCATPINLLLSSSTPPSSRKKLGHFLISKGSNHLNIAGDILLKVGRKPL